MPNSPVVDSHQHFWELSRLEYSWMPEGESPLRRNFLPADLRPLIADAGVDRTVIVQAHQSMDETYWLLDLADETDFVAGVVAWVDLADPNVGATLDELMTRRYFCGVRHLWHDEADLGWVVRPDVIRGLEELAARGIAYDLLSRPPHLTYIPELLEKVPDLRTVVDHISKPLIAEGETEPWSTDLARVAEIPTVMCKVSGMVTEADHESWTPDDLRPYVERVVELFGYDRLMFGSDWPVCTQAATYGQVSDAARDTLGPLSDSDRGAVFGGNAARFYRLDL